MSYITTTDLRTQSTELVASLKLGKKVSLVHRSQIIGEIVPVERKSNTFDLKKFRSFIKPSHDPLSYEEREKKYRKHLEKKYGKDLS